MSFELGSLFGLKKDDMMSQMLKIKEEEELGDEEELDDDKIIYENDEAKLSRSLLGIIDNHHHRITLGMTESQFISGMLARADMREVLADISATYCTAIVMAHAKASQYMSEEDVLAIWKLTLDKLKSEGENSIKNNIEVMEKQKKLVMQRLKKEMEGKNGCAKE